LSSYFETAAANAKSYNCHEFGNNLQSHLFVTSYRYQKKHQFVVENLFIVDGFFGNIKCCAHCTPMSWWLQYRSISGNVNVFGDEETVTSKSAPITVLLDQVRQFETIKTTRQPIVGKRQKGERKMRELEKNIGRKQWERQR